MKIIITLILLAAAAYYYNYQSTRCTTSEDVINKSIELANHINTKKKDISVNKIESMMSNMKNIKALTDTQLACDAMEEIMDEL